jgi:hypothetical protein
MPREILKDARLAPEPAKDKRSCWTCGKHTENFDTKATPFCDACLANPPAARDKRFLQALISAKARLERWDAEDRAVAKAAAARAL